MFCYQVFMQEPSLRTSRLALAGGLAAAILVGGGGFLIGRATTERVTVDITPPPVAIPAPAPTPAPAPIPAARTVLGRAELIALANKAADAAASGTSPDRAVTESAGQRFEIRLPFGCGGPADEKSTAAMRWRYDAEKRALRVHAAPVEWRAADWWAQDPPAGIDVIEGFWLTRPWSSSEACPRGADRPAATGAEAITLPGQTLALGQIFVENGPRRSRRDGQAYQSVQRLAKGEADISEGFRLRLTGRITPMPGSSNPVRCQQPGGSEQRPICLIGVTFDQVAIENAANGESIATWEVSASEAPAQPR